MRADKWKKIWKSEEEKTFQGWDFSYINSRTREQPLPWDYKEWVLSYMQVASTLLDMGTGGGEFLLSLSPPPGRTYATEAYPPNVELCQKTLPAYGIDIRQVFEDELLPFGSAFFDLVMNRHESYAVQEIHRILKPGGIFVTQQVGGQNNRELSRFLLDADASLTAPEFNLAGSIRELEAAAFTILEAREAFPVMKFYDVGALVYFAKIIEWEFPGFSVERCFDPLCKLQQQVEQAGFIETAEHRFMIVARK
ncbi:class I SAM-dependent methyltransferase [Paenibacillus albidus]|uniref:class I SAM-dependent methyltransferase n=1 Tax=Paenibacillus albidus TaxID=2041023 RepID=UPI001BE6F933|nr:class I SAM-dependent methyltransferase [Paenibacillus albidus]MBT2288708.1 class I SAM-dependent methyltransferase [Paenibacillus albidus]